MILFLLMVMIICHTHRQWDSAWLFGCHLPSNNYISSSECFYIFSF